MEFRQVTKNAQEAVFGVHYIRQTQCGGNKGVYVHTEILNHRAGPETLQKISCLATTSEAHS